MAGFGSVGDTFCVVATFGWEKEKECTEDSVDIDLGNERHPLGN